MPSVLNVTTVERSGCYYTGDVIRVQVHHRIGWQRCQ